MSTKKSILIVEDEAMVAEDLKEQIISLGYAVAGITDNGASAIALAKEKSPDLITMDINLSGSCDGISTMEQIRKVSDVPVIYVTAFATDPILERAKRTKPSGYIIKPFNERQVRTSIEIALHNYELERKVTERDALIQALINATENPLVLIDTSGKIQMANKAMAVRAERIPEELIGKPFMDLLPGGGITLHLAEAVQQASNGKGSRFEEEHKGAVYDQSVIPIPGHHGTMQSIAVFCTDITYLKDAAAQLKAANNQLVKEQDRLCTLTAALDSMDDPVIITDPMGAISYVNDEFTSKFGYTLPEVNNTNISTLADPKNTFLLHKEGFMHDQKSVWTGKFIAVNKYGLSMPFLLKSSPVMKGNRLKNRVFVLREDVYGRQ